MKREVIEAMLARLHRYGMDCRRELGLPVYAIMELDEMVRIVCKELNITIDEDPRIEAIMSYTGCSRKVAQDLIDSGEI